MLVVVIFILLLMFIIFLLKVIWGVFFFGEELSLFLLFIIFDDFEIFIFEEEDGWFVLFLLVLFIFKLLLEVLESGLIDKVLFVLFIGKFILLDWLYMEGLVIFGGMEVIFCIVDILLFCFFRISRGFLNWSIRSYWLVLVMVIVLNFFMLFMGEGGGWGEVIVLFVIVDDKEYWDWRDLVDILLFRDCIGMLIWGVGIDNAIWVDEIGIW